MSTPNTPVAGPVGTTADSRNRAIRTFVMGLGTDLLVIAVLFLLPIFNSTEFDWSGTDWKVLALSFAKTVVVTILSYVARKLKIGADTISS